MVWRRQLKGSAALMTAAILAAGSFWSQEFSLRAARRRYAALLEERKYPFLLAGLELQIPSVITTRLARGSSSTIPTRRIVFALSDQCKFCLEAQPTICTLLRSTTFSAEDHLAFISFSGTRIASELQSCVQESGSPQSVVATINDRNEFAALTGILATPSFVVTDGNWRVQRAFTARQLEELRAYVSTAGWSRTVAPDGGLLQ